MRLAPWLLASIATKAPDLQTYLGAMGTTGRYLCQLG
ncbi:hypothetical protein J2Z65_002811 [Paenibacillus aceris]|uniref:Uncharacterized protein n=1 Tax=Paenibacillus aceris TaxID=869555 RepID=A0ABS4HY64_9BACL|nr:hypothetical protein [Paenibacillus aceris]